MTDKQLEFSFMKKNINNVDALGYIGGQDECLGGYCEPLIIKYSDGIEQYILHEMHQSHEGSLYVPGNIFNNHKKVLFSNKLELIEAWGEVRNHLGINKNLPWEKTDAVCGCDATPEEFYKTKRKTLEAVA